MTHSERMKAFELRLLGLSWREIGKRIGYTRATVENDIKACVGGKRKPTPCVYPELKERVIRDYYGSINRLAAEAGVSYNAAYNCLSGRVDPTKGTGAKICAHLGMTMEEAFGEVSKP